MASGGGTKELKIYVPLIKKFCQNWPCSFYAENFELLIIPYV